MVLLRSTNVGVLDVVQRFVDVVVVDFDFDFDGVVVVVVG